MKKLIYKKKTILKNFVVANSIFKIARGLMFASKKKCKQGICFVFKKNLRVNSSITTFFCFHSLDIIFLDENFLVVDKITLKPFILNYTPKKSCRFVFETLSDGFSCVEIGKKLEVEFG